ncbi:MAG: hypothetical protein IPF82_17545 [Blastocatellia bacterium]|nr:hypothetical protein [Blastocatellia bacterium]
MPSSTSSSSFVRFVTRLAIVLALVLAALGVLHALDVQGDVPVIGEKLAHLKANPARYDAVFIGSSYVYREFVPARFDSFAAGAGAPTSSFNMGIPGMDPPETYWLVDRALASGDHRFRFVFIELDSLHSRVRPANLHTRRFDAWHDAAGTLAAIRGVSAGDTSRGKKIKDVASHIEAFVRRAAFIGRGRGLLGAPLLDDAGTEKAPPLGMLSDGYVSLDDEQAKVFALRRDMFGAFEEDRYEEKLAELRAGVENEDGEGRVIDFEIELLRNVVDRVRATGARVILVVPPCLSTRAELIRRAREIDGATVLAFNDPDRYPELYDPELRFDVGHLNAAGAERFTMLLAESVFAAPPPR